MGQLLTKRELTLELNVSTRVIDGLVKARKIPVVIMNRKIVRYSLPDVLAALKKLTRNAME
jgi:hypothetical protein